MPRLSAAAALLLTAIPAMAAGWSEKWTATSTTAMSITGDVVLQTNKIVFAGGKSLPIVKSRNVSFADDMGKILPATIYRIPVPADLSLLNGNRICGGGNSAVPVTYIVIWHTKPIMPGDVAGRSFAAYSGPNEPRPSAAGACGTFSYEPAK